MPRRARGGKHNKGDKHSKLLQDASAQKESQRQAQSDTKKTVPSDKQPTSADMEVESDDKTTPVNAQHKSICKASVEKTPTPPVSDDMVENEVEAKPMDMTLNGFEFEMRLVEDIKHAHVKGQNFDPAWKKLPPEQLLSHQREAESFVEPRPMTSVNGGVEQAPALSLTERGDLLLHYASMTGFTTYRESECNASCVMCEFASKVVSSATDERGNNIAWYICKQSRCRISNLTTENVLNSIPLADVATTASEETTI